MLSKIRVMGIVQGVGFRPFIYRIAVKNQLSGYVRNKADAGVEIVVQGKKSNIESFLQALNRDKPLLAQIHEIAVSDEHSEKRFERFQILNSTEIIESSGSVIPQDTAICDQCLRELRYPSNHRHNYFFITCTDCGPRYTIIEDVPYDRSRTTMCDFSMCDFCRREYSDPSNRRFHAQTVACPVCGPAAYLTDNRGGLLDFEDPIRQAGQLISKGFVVAVKGYGGFHLAATTLRDEPLKRMREVKHRKQKPFAVMARSIDSASTFAEIGPVEKFLLTSYSRPIILLKKKKRYNLSELISPNLHNIGVMLPYTGLHYMLFDEVNDPAFVMTSANPPNQPIIKDDDESLKNLVSVVDYFLFHNRRIAERCDDSVLRIHKATKVFLRRSRGYAPSPIILRSKVRRCALGLGGEKNNTSCVLLGEKAFVSQHIGDVESLETKGFLEKATKRLIRLTNSKIDVVANDLHPTFITTNLALELSEHNNWKNIQVQHHYAHVASLMAEHGINEIIGICCDGYGYGSDGKAWGGEILLCSEDSLDFKRLAHLQKQPLIGGDMATRFPIRMAAGILHEQDGVAEWLRNNVNHLLYGKKEAEIILQQLKSKDPETTTTSCGRVLDAVAAVLDICYERTYEGEPAMKLESVAHEGINEFELEPIVEKNVLQTTPMLLQILMNKKNTSKANLAYFAHSYLAKGFGLLAVEKAQESGLNAIGFTGGVAYNSIIASAIRKIVEEAGLQFFVHENVPPGDGGLSLGQAYVAGSLKL